MAKLQLSVIASGISGKHSGGVFLKGNGGVNIRKKVRPMQTASDYQANVKSHLTYVQSLWATLTAVQVKAWNLLAKTVKVSNVFGDKSELSGRNTIPTSITLVSVSMFVFHIADSKNSADLSQPLTDIHQTPDETCISKVNRGGYQNRESQKYVHDALESAYHQYDEG